jgi:hypothetical protein
MRYFRRNDKREFDEPFEFAVCKPGGLMDHLMNAILLNGVRIIGVAGHQISQLLAGKAGMAIKEVRTDKICSAVILESFDRAIVHVEDNTGWITNGNGHLDL